MMLAGGSASGRTLLVRFIDFRVKIPNPTNESERNHTPRKRTRAASTIPDMASAPSTRELLSFVIARKYRVFEASLDPDFGVR